MADSQVSLVPLSICGSVLGSFSKQLVQRAHTDRQGVAVLAHVATGLYAIRVEPEAGPIELFAPIEIREGRSEYAVNVGRSGVTRAVPEPPGDAIREHEGEIRGTVTQDGNLKPPRCVVVTVDYGPSAGARTYYAVLQDGRLFLRSIAKRPVSISVALPARRDRLSKVPIGTDGGALRFALARTGALSGSVVSADSGKPIDSARVELEPTEATEDRRITIIASTDRKGQWRLDGLAPGPYVLRANAPEYAAAFAQLSADSSRATTEHEFRLERVGEVRGSVIGLPQGQNATVRLLGFRDTTYRVDETGW